MVNWFSIINFNNIIVFSLGFGIGRCWKLFKKFGEFLNQDKQKQKV